MNEKNEKTEEYISPFITSGRTDDKVGEALKVALDIRKFEIDLYWRRATYFWAFIVLAFSGYIAILTAKDIQNRAEILLVITGLGVLFSFGWYCVNRGSKFWQNNWEKHVDLLEDYNIGPLLKTVMLNNDYKLFKLMTPYPFSVSKINQMLSLIVTFVFMLLQCKVLYDNYSLALNIDLSPFIILAVTYGAIILIVLFGRTSLEDKYTTNMNRRSVRVQ